MGTFIVILGVILIIGALIAFFIGNKAVGAGGLVLGIIVTLVSCVTVVPPQTVGVPVTFGKPAAAIGNGLHVKAPWTKIVKLDGTIQNDIYYGGENGSPIEVRLGNNSIARVNATIQWRMRTDNAQQLFLDYRTFDAIRDNLVTRELLEVTNQVMSKYDPLATVEDSNNNQSETDLSSFAEQIKEEMTNRIGKDIEIISVTLPIIAFDDSTQQKIDELQSEIARTRVAEQKKATSEQEAEANEILERSISDNSLTSKCLDIIDRNGGSPLGCFPGSSAQPIINNG